MTHEEFIKVLNGSGYSYEQPHSKIVVTGSGTEKFEFGGNKYR
jgi:hypothetical protein